MRELKWAFIGCGDIAEKVAKELLKDGSGRIASVWNRTRSRAEKFAEKFGGKVHGNAEEAIRADGVDCVYVATTHDCHAQFTKLAVNAGVAVLCEKPITVNTEQCEEVFGLAERKGVYVAEAMWTWHNPVSLKVREWIKDGKIGAVKRVYGLFSFNIVQNGKKRLTSPELIGGALLDIGIYPVRYAYELFGMPESIACSGKLKGGVDFGEKIYMNYGDFEAELVVSMKKLRGEKFVIEGSDGKIVVPFFHSAKSAKLTGKHREIFKSDCLAYGLQLRHTAEDVLSGKTESDHCPRTATLETMKLLDECRRQMGLIYPCETAD